MRPQTPFRRFAMLATLAALIASVIPAAPAALAADPPGQDREIRLSRTAGTPRGDGAHRSVTVRDLPAATTDTSGSESLDLGSGAAPQTPSSTEGLTPLPVPAVPSTTPAAMERTSFAGLANASTVEPPDPSVAVGPDDVIQAVNTTIRTSDRSGGDAHDVSMYQFFGLTELRSPTGGPYLAETSNPRIIFDSVQNRWLAIETSFDCYPRDPEPPLDPGADVGTGYIDIAISRTMDAHGTWDVLSLAYPDMFPDDLGLGTSTDKVVASANVYGLVAGGGANGCQPHPTFLGTELDVMAWSELKAAGLVHIDYLYTDFAPGSSYANNYTSWRPAVQAPATSAKVYLVARQRSDDGVAYAEITGDPADAGLTPLTITDLTSAGVVGGFADPPDPKQPGAPATIVDALDGRPTDAIWQANRLAFVSTYPCATRACVRITELATGTSPTRSQDMLIADAGKDNYMGGIGFARNGDLHAVWTRSSATPGDFPSTYTAMHLPGDAANTLGYRTQIASGTGAYPGSRWGEHVGLAQDPQVPNAVWQADEYSAGAAGWATEVSQLQTGGSSYVPITPLRVLDSRPGGTGLTGTFNANSPRSFQVAGLGGPTGIPANAIAVTGNVTVVNQTAAGYVSVTPTATADPTSSTINFPLNDIRANNVTVPLATNGNLSAVYKAVAGKKTHLVVDITGYFLAGAEDGTYTAVAPVRVLDTRPGGTGLSGTFTPNVPRKLTIGGTHGIPADATAITGNLTVVGQTGAGYLAITKTSLANPPTSTLNFPLGDIRANGVSVPLNSDDALWIVYKAVSGARTHVILDVTGYYREAPSGLLFYPLTPGRTMDTRAAALQSGLSGAFAANTPRRLQVSGHWGVPAGAEAITGNLTVVNQTAAGYVAATLESLPNPTTSVINFPLNDIRANGVTLPVNTGGRSWFVYKATGGKTTHLVLDVSGYFD